MEWGTTLSAFQHVIQSDAEVGLESHEEPHLHKCSQLRVLRYPLIGTVNIRDNILALNVRRRCHASTSVGAYTLDVF